MTDEAGNPCYNAHVELFDAQEVLLYSAKTDVTGHAYLTYDLGGQKTVPASVRVNGETTFPFSEEMTVKLSEEAGSVKALDLMFTVDTTGSMGDELKYLQAELADVVTDVAATAEKTLSIRVSVNFYRDEGDEYLVRAFDFTEDLKDVTKTLQAQTADGGGDYPEAVHTAPDNAVSAHRWREDAVKLLFFVLDAPPHSEKEIIGINKALRETVTEAARQGIRIIPVASSGVDTETEFLMRSYAVMTGGSYIFLTDRSGIGGEHLEPTVGEYEVEALNECLVRVIKAYCGLKER